MPNQARMNAGLSYVLLATLGWSLSGLFVRLLPGLDGWQINAWRGFWLWLALLVYLLLRHGRRTLIAFDAIPFLAVLVSSLCFAIGTTAYVGALTLVSTATVAVIGATSPLITGLLSPWITGERPHASSWIAGIVGMVGMIIIARQGYVSGNVIGILLAICVPLTFSLQTLLLRRYRYHDMMLTICAGGFVTFILAGFASLTSAHGNAFSVSWHEFQLLAAMGVVQLALPLVFYGWGAKTVPAVTLSIVAMLDAVFNPLWPWLVVGERPDTTSLIGGAVVLGGVLICVLGGHYLPQDRYE